MINRRVRPKGALFSWLRFSALCRKEFYQISRDPSSALIAVVIPVLLLFIFGFGINLDSSRLRIGLLVETNSQEAHQFVDMMQGSPFFETIMSYHKAELIEKLQRGQIRGIVTLPADFSQKLYQEGAKAPIQVITDGSEPNTASFVQAYTAGIWQQWQASRLASHSSLQSGVLQVNMRFWFNPTMTSKNFIIPGAVTIIMTVVGTILTSLVIAREWERGTMEALLSTQVTKLELLLSKIIPYYLLGMLSMVVCIVVSVFVMGVPYRGSLILLFLLSSLFLGSSLGMGLLISTVTRNQFNSAMIALNAGFLPAVMLSGFIFEIESMPSVLQVVTYVIPARYFVSTLQSLFLVGNVAAILWINTLFLIISALFFLGLTLLKTRRRLD